MAALVARLSGSLDHLGEARFAAGFRALFIATSLALLLIIVGVAWWRGRRQPGAATTTESFDGAAMSGAGWVVGLVLILGSAATLNLVVDPYGMYGSGILAPVSMQMRRLKTEAYTALPRAPQVVVLGSSIAHPISPTTLRNELGLSAFNAAVGSGRIDDFLIQARFMRSRHGGLLPKVFFVQLSPNLPFGGRHTADLTPLTMLPFMPPTLALSAVRQRFSRVLERGQVADALYVLVARPADSRSTAAREIDRHGELTAMLADRRSPPLAAERFERRLERFIRRARKAPRTPPCRQLNPRALHDLDEFLRLTTGAGSSVVFYLSPTHPRYRRAVIEPDEPIPSCRQQLSARLRKRAATDDAVDFLDFTRLDSIGGEASSVGYIDPFHLTLVNGDRLVAAAAPTLRAAMRRASAATPGEEAE